MLQKAFFFIVLGTVFMSSTLLPDMFKGTAEASISETATTKMTTHLADLSDSMDTVLELASLFGGFFGIILVFIGTKELYSYVAHGGDYGPHFTSSSMRGHTATVTTEKKEATGETQQSVALKKEASPAEPKGSTFKATRTQKKKVQHIDISGRKRASTRQSSLLDDIVDAVPKPSPMPSTYSDSCSSNSSSSSSSSFGDSGSSSGCD